jgi:hydroxymethylglutaryl-CoA lyase
MNFPKRVQINEVVLRDGLQLEKKVISVEEKKTLFSQLMKAKVNAIEFGSFVHPRLVPQMANSGDFYSVISGDSNHPTFIALIPNLKGAENAHAHGVKQVNFVFSASDTHNLQNVHKSTDESLNELKTIQEFCIENNIILNVSIATSFGCPFEGDVPLERIRDVVKKVNSMGLETITLADTTGMANPQQVYDLLVTIQNEFPKQKLNLHFHNTRGMGLSNIIAGMQAGIASYDTSLGGLGGCPFAPGATGNVCTEDVVHMLHSMGIETGLSLDDLIAASHTLAKIVEHETPSYISKAGPFNRKYPIPVS